MKWFVFLFAVFHGEKLKNGKLELETEFDFDNDVYFDRKSFRECNFFLINLTAKNMAHLNSVLRNHPMREPNKQVRRKMLDPVKKEEVEAVTGWSCNFEKGLCDGWSTISEMDFATVLSVGLTRRPANFYIGEINQFSTSIFTGPSIDHTTLSVYGHALYADSKRARPGGF